MRLDHLLSKEHRHHLGRTVCGGGGQVVTASDVRSGGWTLMGGTSTAPRFRGKPGRSRPARTSVHLPSGWLERGCRGGGWVYGALLGPEGADIPGRLVLRLVVRGVCSSLVSAGSSGHTASAFWSSGLLVFGSVVGGGCRVWGRGWARCLRTAQWTRASLFSVVHSRMAARDLYRFLVVVGV